jgi:hypothetical protein
MSVGGLGGMTPAASDGPVYQTVGDAFDGISKAAMTKIGSSKEPTHEGVARAAPWLRP